MRPRATSLCLLLVLAMLSAGGSAQVSPAERDLHQTFGQSQGVWQERVRQDETQRLCSGVTAIPDAQLGRVRALAALTIEYPSEDKLIGNWHAGQTIAMDLKGGRFTDPPGTPTGGACIACHVMDDHSAGRQGTVGPTLVAYGREHGFRNAARVTYAKIYNSNATMPCSRMPRFGYHHVLSMQQIADVTAFLLDPDSSLNH